MCASGRGSHATGLCSSDLGRVLSAVDQWISADSRLPRLPQQLCICVLCAPVVRSVPQRACRRLNARDIEWCSLPRAARAGFMRTRSSCRRRRSAHHSKSMCQSRRHRSRRLTLAPTGSTRPARIHQERSRKPIQCDTSVNTMHQYPPPPQTLSQLCRSTEPCHCSCTRCLAIANR